MNYNDIFWRFQGNQNFREYGLNTSEMETFMKDPVSSLTREICQNSIDARRDKNLPVRVEFKVFDLKVSDIPGYNDIRNQIKLAIDNWEEKTNKNLDMIDRLKEMQDTMRGEYVKCLRISDFNTTGLLGVSTNEDSDPFYMLTKGSGQSVKSGSSGGSKGIGKYASFVASKIHTVFYSTITEREERGHAGIIQLCSAKIEGSDEKTTGEGYFGFSNKNSPILEELVLDKNFYRSDQYGTDVYVIAFDEEDNWKDQIIKKTLESFMVAVDEKSLEVIVDDILVNHDTLETNVKKDIIQKAHKQEKNNIMSQYLLLRDSSTHTELIDTEGYGFVEFKFKRFTSDEENYATHKTLFVRYPYMAIQFGRNKLTSANCSAMAIIHDNKLNETLRKFENPEHTSWDFKRNDITKEKKDLASHLWKILKQEIQSIVEKLLSKSNTDKTDFYGAGEYLPRKDDNGDEKDLIENSKPSIIPPKKVKNYDDSPTDYSDSDDAVMPDLGNTKEDGDNVLNPEGNNDQSSTSRGPGGGESGIEDGDTEVFSKVLLKGISYRLIAINEGQGEYAIAFKYHENLNNCEVIIKMLDDNNSKSTIDILSAKSGDTNLTVSNNIIKGFDIRNQGINTIFFTTNQNEFFSSEVKIYASR